jgi:hypothetical protein
MSVVYTPRACPECGLALDGLAGDAVYGCSACSLAVVVSDGRRLPLRFVRSPRQQGAAVVVPVYEFPVRPVFAPESEVPEKLKRIQRGFVAGCRVRRFQDYGDLGVEYTRRQTRFEQGRSGHLGHCSRTPEDAAWLLRVILARVTAELSQASHGLAAAELGEPILWGLGCRVEGGLVCPPWTGIRYPAALVEAAATPAPGLTP